MKRATSITSLALSLAILAFSAETLASPRVSIPWNVWIYPRNSAFLEFRVSTMEFSRLNQLENVRAEVELELQDGQKISRMYEITEPGAKLHGGQLYVTYPPLPSNLARAASVRGILLYSVYLTPVVNRGGGGENPPQRNPLEPKPPREERLEGALQGASPPPDEVRENPVPPKPPNQDAKKDGEGPKTKNAATPARSKSKNAGYLTGEKTSVAGYPTESKTNAEKAIDKSSYDKGASQKGITQVALDGSYSIVVDGQRGLLRIHGKGGEYYDSTKKQYSVVVVEDDHHVVLYVIGLAKQNADDSGGQKFDGYLMTKSGDIAGITWLEGSPFGFYAIRQGKGK